jgi:hypothetical protein
MSYLWLPKACQRVALPVGNRIAPVFSSDSDAILFWFRCHTLLIQMPLSSDSDFILFWFRCHTLLIQISYSSDSDFIFFWFRFHTLLIQISYSSYSDLILFLSDAILFWFRCHTLLNQMPYSSDSDAIFLWFRCYNLIQMSYAVLHVSLCRCYTQLFMFQEAGVNVDTHVYPRSGGYGHSRMFMVRSAFK